MYIDTLDWAVPVVALGLGAFGLGLAWFLSYRFDRKYGRGE
jgi:hypothetical protein